MTPSPHAPPSLPSPGTVVDGYVVESLIGRGGMAAVYSARGLSQGDRVALKMLLPAVATNRGVVAMLFDESQIAGRIEHENVVRVLATGNWCRTPYLRLELVDGWSYARTIKRARRAGLVLPRGFHAAVLAQVALGLSAAHQACDAAGQPLGVVHRDVKPENVLVGFDGAVKLVDFGIARAKTRSAATRAGCMKGTLGYMAPEQFVAPNAVTHRADLWSLGAMAWEALAERPLFCTRSVAEAMLSVVYGEIPDLATLRPELPEDLRELIRRCLSRDPAFRPETAAEVAHALAVIAFSEGFGDPARIGAVVAEIQGRLMGTPPSAHASVAPPPARRRSSLAAGVALCALSLVASVTAAWALHSRPEMPSARLSAAHWRVERPRFEEPIPVVDPADLALEP